MKSKRTSHIKLKVKASNQWRRSWPVIIAVGIVGTVLLASSHAATPAASIEADSGTISSAAAKVSDSTASGGSAVKFKATTTVGGGTTPTGFPNASNTGPAAAGYTDLTAHAGGWTISVSGTYTGYNVSGTVNITASNVTLQGCDIHGATDGDLVTVSGNNVIIQDCNIHGEGTSTATAAQNSLVQVYADHFTLKRSNLYNSSGDGVRLAESTNIDLEDNYIHDWVLNPTNEPHCDGIVPGEGTVGPWTVRHNTVLMWSPGHMSNVISLAGGQGKAEGPTLVDGNLLAGGGDVIHGGGDTNYTSTVFSNNEFSTQFDSNVGTYGIMTIPPVWGTRGSSWTNNKYYDGPNAGQIIPAP